MESSVVGIYCGNNLPKVEQCQGVLVSPLSRELALHASERFVDYSFLRWLLKMTDAVGLF